MEHVIAGYVVGLAFVMINVVCCFYIVADNVDLGYCIY